MSTIIARDSEAAGLADEVELWDRVLDNRRRFDRYHVQSAWGDNRGKRQEPKNSEISTIQRSRFVSTGRLTR